ncbi:MAG: CBS domain-containing protein [Myxococcales bacterium]|nr:CBS domain-containing protein [Myxococcales bacterium]
MTASPFAQSVAEWMSPALYTVPLSASLEQADMEMSVRTVSALIVVDGDARAVGVISRTDLLRHRAHAGAIVGSQAAQLAVVDLCRTEAITVDSEATMREAARLMAKQGVHRLMVTDDDEPVGVLSVSDILRAVAHSRLQSPLSELSSETIAHIAPDDSVARAIQRLDSAQVRGLVVMQDGWPVGVFTQSEALAAGDAGDDTRVEHWMSPAVLCLPGSTQLHRAARQSMAMHAPLIVVLDNDKPAGVVTPTDLLFAVI